VITGSTQPLIHLSALSSCTEWISQESVIDHLEVSETCPSSEEMAFNKPLLWVSFFKHLRKSER